MEQSRLSSNKERKESKLACGPALCSAEGSMSSATESNCRRPVASRSPRCIRPETDQLNSRADDAEPDQSGRCDWLWRKNAILLGFQVNNQS